MWITKYSRQEKDGKSKMSSGFLELEHLLLFRLLFQGTDHVQHHNAVDSEYGSNGGTHCHINRVQIQVR